MLDFLFTGWGAFAMTLFLLVPFLLVFVYVIYRKSVADSAPSGMERKQMSRLEGIWITVVLVIFVGVNLASISYMPIVATARAASASTSQNIQQVDFSARSWAYEISERNLEMGRPVRFSGRSTDTMHGFAVYHPDGRVLFTMMLMPGLKGPTSLIHTFNEPGKYKVRCLEYCGIAHHLMQDELIVAKSGN
jgi:cytochrome c oxidase subunit 2